MGENKKHWLERLIEEQNMSFADFYKASGFNRSTLASIIKRDNKYNDITPTTKERLASYLGISESELMQKVMNYDYIQNVVTVKKGRKPNQTKTKVKDKPIVKENNTHYQKGIKGQVKVKTNTWLDEIYKLIKVDDDGNLIVVSDNSTFTKENQKKFRNITQYEVAKRTGIRNSTLSAIRTKNISIDTVSYSILKKLAEMLELSGVDELVNKFQKKKD